ncbi:MAG: YjfI family protein [Gammaproteobacteria bacterium]|nr:YjfI family protein [Gammaproteobacteria bacterium]
MVKKSSAHYQREYRKRLREQGLVKKEVWIRPGNAKRLSIIEKHLRLTGEPAGTIGEEMMMMKTPEWTTGLLYEELQCAELFASGEASVELIDGTDPSLHIVMAGYGDLPIFLTVAGEQIIVEAVLWQASAVRDRAGFNEMLLRTHKFFPLSSIGLESMSGAEDYYHMFGALSSGSILASVVLEIEMLASNVIQATEAYSDYLDIQVA